jgi:hypothetical protein
MNTILTTHEAYVRLGIFLGLFIVIAVAEAMFPRRVPVYPKITRWFNNLSITLINTVALRLIFPLIPVAFASISLYISSTSSSTHYRSSGVST